VAKVTSRGKTSQRKRGGPVPGNTDIKRAKKTDTKTVDDGWFALSGAICTLQKSGEECVDQKTIPTQYLALY
jgi:hypothetical protein